MNAVQDLVAWGDRDVFLVVLVGKLAGAGFLTVFGGTLDADVVVLQL